MKRLAPVFILAVLALGLNTYAHDGEVAEVEYADFSFQEWQHDDLDPWKGWFNLKIVWNLCNEDWGDFHFVITDRGCGGGVTFDPNMAPLSSQNISSWVVNNNAPGGPTLDIYFYDDPVEQYEWGYFKVYTDNTWHQRNYFGVKAYPTPVPEPATLLFLAGGMVGLVALRKRKMH